MSRALWVLLVVGLVIAPTFAGQKARERSPGRTAFVPGVNDVVCASPDVVLYEQVTGLSHRTRQVVNDRTEWCELWDEIYSLLQPAPACDTTLIDFNTHFGVVVGLGSRPNLCYGLSLPLVCGSPSNDGQIQVMVVENVPGHRCMCALSVAHPLAVIAVERPVARVSFRHAIQVNECEPPADDL